MKIIFDYNRTIFDPETDDLYQGVFELISDLSKKYELYLVSESTLLVDIDWKTILKDNKPLKLHVYGNTKLLFVEEYTFVFANPITSYIVEPILNINSDVYPMVKIFVILWKLILLRSLQHYN